MSTGLEPGDFYAAFEKAITAAIEDGKKAMIQALTEKLNQRLANNNTPNEVPPSRAELALAESQPGNRKSRTQVRSLTGIQPLFTTNPLVKRGGIPGGSSVGDIMSVMQGAAPPVQWSEEELRAVAEEFGNAFRDAIASM